MERDISVSGGVTIEGLLDFIYYFFTAVVWVAFELGVSAPGSVKLILHSSYYSEHSCRLFPSLHSYPRHVESGGGHRQVGGTLVVES